VRAYSSPTGGSGYNNVFAASKKIALNRFVTASSSGLRNRESFYTIAQRTHDLGYAAAEPPVYMVPGAIAEVYHNHGV
jgi:hypothetical protein